MIKINKKTLIIIITIIATALIIAYMLFTKNNDEIITNLEEIETNENDTQNNQKETNENKIIIHITGEIKKEGIYELKENSRIADAIEAAGGVTENADLDEVNLAFVLSDGQKIYIPNKNEKEISGEKVYIMAGSGNNVIVEDKVERGKKQKVNINEAKQEDFEQLPGIGPSIAKKIIEYREQNGKFTSIDELQEVKGIGEAKFENIKEYIMVKLYYFAVYLFQYWWFLPVYFITTCM